MPSSPFSSTERTRNIAAMDSEHFDVLVIGGGVVGAGVALDAVARGYKVALVEKADFASGTSSKSTKLIHGGIRYLPNFDFALVHEALNERSILLRNAPFLVHPIGFILPIYYGWRHPLGLPITLPGGIGLGFVLSIGLWLYDGMAGRRQLTSQAHWHRHLRRKGVEELAPALNTEGLKDGFLYYDAQTNDARLTMALMRTAAEFGATITNYTGVTSFIIKHGKISGARVCDNVSNQEFTVYARHIVNAAGVFAEQVEALTGQPPQVQIDPSKGVHLVLSREVLKLGDNAIVLPETDDKRILFIVPWESRAIFGTTDTGYLSPRQGTLSGGQVTGDLNHPVATQEDISYLLKHLNRYLLIHLTEADIISTYAGYRPLIQSRSSEHSTAKLSRTHAVLQNPSGLVSIVGGKLTTYRRMAQDTVDVLNRRDGANLRHPTQKLPLLGSRGWPAIQRDLEVKGSSLGLGLQTITHLGKSYGSEATYILSLIGDDASLAKPLIDDLPYIRAEVVHACRQEMAMMPYDVLARRTSITLEDRQRGLGIVGEVAALMAKEHNWSTEQQRELVEAYSDDMERQMNMEKHS